MSRWDSVSRTVRRGSDEQWPIVQNAKRQTIDPFLVEEWVSGATGGRYCVAIEGSVIRKSDGARSVRRRFLYSDAGGRDAFPLSDIPTWVAEDLVGPDRLLAVLR